MLKILPINFYTSKKQWNTYANFPTALAVQNPTSQDVFTAKQVQNKFSESNDDILIEALNQLNQISFDKKDIEHIQSLAITMPFKNGSEAYNFIKLSNIKLKFNKLENGNIHAQYNFKDNSININEKYKNTKSKADVLAISEAILHEAGHAKDQDEKDSIQEELECLALNATAHRYLDNKYPGIFSKSSSLIVKEGVCVYANLFFDKKTSKTSLITRLQDKYNDLPAGDSKHPPSKLALEIKKT